MKNTHLLKLILGLTSATVFISLLLVIFLYLKRRTRNGHNDVERPELKHVDDKEIEDLLTFQGGEDLIASDILDAPGEVIGTSNYGTLYKALLHRGNCLRLLRFLRPVCTIRAKDFGEAIQLLGSIRHPNLVPLLGFYAGREVKSFLFTPFSDVATWLSSSEKSDEQLWKMSNDIISSEYINRYPNGNAESHKWTIIYRISVGIAKALNHLHTGFQKPVIHGNLKLKNIFLDRYYQPYISDFGLHLLLNSTAGQEMLEASAADGYRAPELIKMKDASEQTDIHSLGIILLELLSGKESLTHLPTFMRKAVLDSRITDLYHPDILLNDNNDDGSSITEQCLLKFFQLAMSCCSPSPSLRPNIRQVLCQLEEIGR